MKRKLLISTFALLLFACLLPVAMPVLTACSEVAALSVVGDTNGDGSVNNLDATQVLKYDAALIELTKTQLDKSNVNDDKVVNNLDAAMILRYDAGMLDKFPADVDDETSADTGSEDSSVVEHSKEETTEDNTSQIEYPEGAYIVKSYTDINDVAWADVPRADIDIYKWVNSAEYEAYAQLVYIEDYGFLCRMTCMEEDPLAVYTQFGDPVYLDSCMEFFASWDNVSYINIESNSVGAICSQFGKTKNDRKPITDYIPTNEIFDVNPVVESDRWTLTMDIPIKTLQKFYGSSMSADTFVSGYTFKGNFYKIGSDAVTGIRHYGMWTEVSGNTPNFHQPDCFGTLVIE